MCGRARSVFVFCVRIALETLLESGQNSLKVMFAVLFELFDITKH